MEINKNVSMAIIGMEKNVFCILIYVLRVQFGIISTVSPLDHAKMDFILMIRATANLCLRNVLLLLFGLKIGVKFLEVNALQVLMPKVESAYLILNVKMV